MSQHSSPTWGDAQRVRVYHVHEPEKEKITATTGPPRGRTEGLAHLRESKGRGMEFDSGLFLNRMPCCS